MAARAPGRPRSAEADAAIFGATLDLLREVGFRALSVEAVRERAGVGKATIYRRYPDKVALVRATIASLQPSAPVLPDTGSVRDDVVAAFRAMYSGPTARDGGTSAVLLLAESAADPDLHELFRSALIDPRRAAMGALLERGIARGELRADVEVDLAIDLLAGPVIYRVLIQGGDLERAAERLERYVDTVLRGLA